MTLRVGIVGGGIGGLTAAIALRKIGQEVVVYEQARQFSRVGADINLTPNAAIALEGLGLGPALRATAAFPTHRLSRTWDTGEVTSRIEMRRAAEERYGASQYTMHRADLLAALEAALPPNVAQLGKRLVTINDERDLALRFADGSTDQIDVLIGADGIHSVVRAHLFGPDHPRFTGNVCFRSVVPIERVANLPHIDAFTKWWGPGPAEMLVQFPISSGKVIFVFATAPQTDWRDESWTVPGNVEELRRLYAAFHIDVRKLLDAVDEVLKQALYDRDPLRAWSRGRVTLLGDACHPMLPFMAQGSAMAIEDAIVLARHLAGVDRAGVADALRRYGLTRLDRSSRVQLGSRANNWLREGNNGDWLYGYDAWHTPLAS
ncbi:MAG: FAD-binding protein [Betaproteobacteria bacterium]|nr:FAD-binding protein [Betaproteobacteria bacterium]